MKTRMVTRNDICAALLDWQCGKISAQEIWKWANERFCPGETEYDDWEGDNSVAKEVLAELDCLDMNMVLAEDIPIHLEFLGTPFGCFHQGYKRWTEALGVIDFNARKSLLMGNPIYDPFCK